MYTDNEIKEIIFKENDSVSFKGESLAELPSNLYVPLNALRVVLASFDGPLDLLLYLIKKQNIDILDIPIAPIAAQYMLYLELMKELKIDIIADYLVMAAMLAEIKSKMLLPVIKSPFEEEEDPRAELIRRLQEYEKYKLAAVQLDNLPRQERDIFAASVKMDNVIVEQPELIVHMDELLVAFNEVLERASLNAKHLIKKEIFNIRERMTLMLDKLSIDAFTYFHDLFNLEEGKIGIVVTFIALLELIKQGLIVIVQASSFQPIHIKRT